MKVTIPVSNSNTKPILTLLEDMGYTLPCNCNGQHRCNGNVYSFDCSLIPRSSVTVELPAADRISSDSHIQGITWETEPIPGPTDTLLIDLGTTTIAMMLLQNRDGAPRQTSLSANPQRKWGTDVIARLHAATHGKLSLLKDIVTDLLQKQAEALCTRNHQKLSEIQRCYIGGNTAMIHILMGYDCSTLAVSPFTPAQAPPAPFSYHQCQVCILPWISAFIGGDITAGLYACQLPGADTSLLIDLGTNGELVLSHQGVCYTAATAAGPAFEGGGLSCGCASIPGAITAVSLGRMRPLLTTIDNKLPIGICGSGALSLCAELLRKGFVTKEGILSSRFPKEGIFLSNTPDGTSLRFTPEDFRSVQLAVAAIAAGIETLCHEAHITPADVSHLYLGGGFGVHLAQEDARILRLFSTVPEERIQLSGNTCLSGLYRCALEPDSPPTPPVTRFVELSDSAYFKKQFVHHMTYSD